MGASLYEVNGHLNLDIVQAAVGVLDAGRWMDGFRFLLGTGENSVYNSSKLNRELTLMISNSW